MSFQPGVLCLVSYHGELRKTGLDNKHNSNEVLATEVHVAFTLVIFKSLSSRRNAGNIRLHDYSQLKLDKTYLFSLLPELQELKLV